MSIDWAELDRKCLESTGYDARTIATSQTPPAVTDIWWFTYLMIVKLEDGRSIGIPTTWYPEINKAGQDERARWRLDERKTTIRWPELGLELQVADLLQARARPASRTSP